MPLKEYTFDLSMSDALYRLQRDLYARDRQYVVPFRSAFLEQFTPAFTFYRRSANKHCHWLAKVGNKVVGHISALLNADLRDFTGEAVGTVGFFECVRDAALAQDLLEHATMWLRSQHLSRIWGPVQFDIWHGYRFMTDGFDRHTFYGEPYNKSYYPEYFERFGFIPLKRWHSFEVTGRGRLKEMAARFAERHNTLVKEGYRFRRIRAIQEHDIHDFHLAVTRSYAKFLGSTPLALKDFTRLFAQQLAVCPEYFLNLLYDPAANVAGFSIAYPDFTEAIRAMQGQATILRKVRFFFRSRFAPRAIFYMVGATPEEVQRRHGLGSAAVHQTIRQILDSGFDRVLFALLAEDSGGRRHLSQETLTAPLKSYALYEYAR